MDLGYFNCETKADCQAYLAKVAPARELDHLKLRAHGISAESLAALNIMFDMARKAEGLGPAQIPDE